MERLETEIKKVDITWIPDPEMHIEQAHLEGSVDPGQCDWSVDQPPYIAAKVEYNQGSFEVYEKQKGDINRWITQDKYDIYA